MSTTYEDLAVLDIELSEPSDWQRIRITEKTLGEDFQWWWNLPKYKKQKIEARDKYSNVMIVARNCSMSNWPNQAIEVTYWVELANGLAVGFREIEKGKCTFPVVRMKVPKGSEHKVVL